MDIDLVNMPENLLDLDDGAKAIADSHNVLCSHIL